MPKIKKDTIKKFPQTASLKIFKFENSKNYYCSFYVGTHFTKSGNVEKSLKTQNVNDATKLAKQEFEKHHIENKDNVKKEYDFTNDIAKPYIKMRLRKYKSQTGKKNLGERDSQKYFNYMEKYFENIDYRNNTIVEETIEDLVENLRMDNKSDSTISKYTVVLSNMFNHAIKNSVVNHKPEMPKLKIISQQRPSYFNDELNLISKKLYEEYERTEDVEYLEIKDYINLIRSAGFRPGLEPLRIKRFQYRFINDEENPSNDEEKVESNDGETLPTREIMKCMQHCKVLFSFGSKNGGLKLAKLLRNELRKDNGWNVQSSAYIDCVDIKDHKDTRETPWVGKDGRPVCDFDGEPIIKVTNCHWAEFYYGAMIYAKVVVILFDSAWRDSKWCLGEWQLFLKHSLDTYVDDQYQEQQAYNFDLVVVFHGKPRESEEVMRTLNKLKLPSVLLENIQLIPATIHGKDTSIKPKDLKKFVQICQESATFDGAEEKLNMTEEESLQAHIRIYDQSWKEKALDVQIVQPDGHSHWWNHEDSAPVRSTGHQEGYPSDEDKSDNETKNHGERSFSLPHARSYKQSIEKKKQLQMSRDRITNRLKLASKSKQKKVVSILVVITITITCCSQTSCQ